MVELSSKVYIYWTQKDQTSLTELAATKADSRVTSGHIGLSREASWRRLFCACVRGDNCIQPGGGGRHPYLEIGRLRPVDIQTVVTLKQHISTPLSLIQSISQIALANMAKISQTKPRRWNNGYYSNGVEGVPLFFSVSHLVRWFARLNSQSQWLPSPTGSAAERERPVGSKDLATDRLPGAALSFSNAL